MTQNEVPPITDTGSRVMYAMHQIRIATGDRVAAALGDLRLTGTQALILEILAETDGVSAAELARRCLVSRQALSGPLDQLQQRGLMQRPDPSVSARIRPSTLTDEGRAIAQQVRERVARLERASTEIFTAHELSAFRGMLARYADFWLDSSAAAVSARPRRRASSA